MRKQFKNFDNILVIDDSNMPVNYSKSAVSSNYVYKLSIDDLSNIFNESQDDIFKYDTSDCLTLILKDNSEISLHEYSLKLQVAFLKISTPELKVNDNDILISTDIYHHPSLIWQTEHMLINHDLPNYINIDEAIAKALQDFNGYQNCFDILHATKLSKSLGEAQAVKYWTNTKIKVNKHIYRGYLPALGQLYIFHKYKPLIQYVLSAVSNNKNFDKLFFPHSMSSTEYNRDTFWSLAISSLGNPPNIVALLNTKTFNRESIPFFTEKRFY